MSSSIVSRNTSPTRNWWSWRQSLLWKIFAASSIRYSEWRQIIFARCRKLKKQPLPRLADFTSERAGIDCLLRELQPVNHTRLLEQPISNRRNRDCQPAVSRARRMVLRASLLTGALIQPTRRNFRQKACVAGRASQSLDQLSVSYDFFADRAANPASFAGC